jgi:hypothetical protein
MGQTSSALWTHALRPAHDGWQVSGAPTEAPAAPAPARSPFQKPSVQVHTVSDDGSEAPTNVSPRGAAGLSFHTVLNHILLSGTACVQPAACMVPNRHACLGGGDLACCHSQQCDQVLVLQGDLASAEMPATWHSDELPDAEALVSLTFRLLFPDTFQHILPVHKHKVPPPTTTPSGQCLVSFRPKRRGSAKAAALPHTSCWRCTVRRKVTSGV